MEKVSLKATTRKNITKSERKKIRQSGRVPGIFYSKHSNPIAIDVTEKAIHPLVFTSKAHLISLEIEGQEDYECIIKDVQFDPVTDRVIHFDLLGLTKGEKIQLEIPVQLVGTAIGIKEGGILQHILHKLNVECLPKDIPEYIEIDISALKLGDSVHVGDLTRDNLDFLNPKNSLIVSVTHPKIKEETVATAAEAGVAEESAEPEVIGKGKAAEEKEEE
jgi:large subunit ribosomal protein L25